METSAKRMAFRLVGADGYGPWTSATRFGWRHHLPDDWQAGARSAGDMPPPEEDTHHQGLLSITNTGRFAFPSIERLRYWFCPVTLAYAHSKGAKLEVYEVERYVLYDNQLVFSTRGARLVGEYPLTRLMGAPWHDAAWG